MTLGMYIEVPKPQEIEAAREIIIPKFEAFGIREPDLRLYIVSYKW